VLLGAGLILSGRTEALWQFYVTFGVMVGFGVSCFYVPLTVTVIRWFDHRRGLAASIVSSGNGLGTLALAPLTRWLINNYDWRTAFLILGEIALVVVIPAALLLRPAPGAALPSAQAAPGPALTARKLWTFWPFWAIALTHFACCAAHSGPIFHMVSHAIDLGVPALAAAGALGISGLTSIIGRVGTGLVADRVGAKRTLIVGLILQAMAIFLYVFAREAGTLYALAMVFGVAYGSVMPLYAVVTREYFGDRAWAPLAAFSYLLPGHGAGLLRAGVIHDGSARTSGSSCRAPSPMAIVLGFTLRPPGPRFSGDTRAALGGKHARHSLIEMRHDSADFLTPHDPVTAFRSVHHDQGNALPEPARRSGREASCPDGSPEGANPAAQATERRRAPAGGPPDLHQDHGRRGRRGRRHRGHPGRAARAGLRPGHQAALGALE
jgi:MFS family permease